MLQTLKFAALCNSEFKFINLLYNYLIQTIFNYLQIAFQTLKTKEGPSNLCIVMIMVKGTAHFSARPKH